MTLTREDGGNNSAKMFCLELNINGSWGFLRFFISELKSGSDMWTVLRMRKWMRLKIGTLLNEKFFFLLRDMTFFTAIMMTSFCSKI
jgi:hypothetical protein